MWMLHLGDPRSSQENAFLYKPIWIILNSEASKLIYSHFLEITFFLLGLCSTFLLKWVLRGPIFMWGSQYKFVPNLVWTQHQFLMLIQQHISYSLIFRMLFSSRWRIKPQYNFHLQFPFFCYFLEVPSIDFKRMFIVVHLSFYVLLCEDFLINWCFIQII